MGKVLVGAALGVFVGAMVVEILRRTSPEWFQKLKRRITKSASAAKNAFMEGYRGTEPA